MTHQVSVPRGGSAPTAERTGSTQGAPIRKLIVYTLATLAVAASVTVAAVVVSSDDAPTSTGFPQAAADPTAGYIAQAQARAAADTAASYSAQAQAHQAAQAREQQYVGGLNPATDVPGSLGLSGSAGIDGSFQVNETARMGALSPTIDGSFQANETARLQALVNGINPATDVPGTLAAAGIDGSFQANETARMEALVNGINPADDPERTLWASRHR